MKRVALALFAAALLALAALAPGASAATAFCPPGSGAGQCERPHGIAVDTETGRLYIADERNNRVDVFDSDGTFRMAFGWGVKDGTTNALQSCGPQATPPTVSCFKGIAGSGAGQFSNPPWIAVDNDPASPSRHDVYVGADNFHVQKFGPEGNLLLSFGSEGKGECQFMRANDPIAVGPGGDLYLADSYDKDGEGPLHVFVNRIERFDSSGNCLGEVVLFEEEAHIPNFAVDSGGNSYVTVEGLGFGVLRKYDPSGALLYELDKGTETNGLAIDASDDVFAQQSEDGVPGGFNYMITEYDSAGNRLHRFGYGTLPYYLPGLAAYHSAGGDVFGSLEISSGEQGFGITYYATPKDNRPIVVPKPCEANPLGNTKATLNALVNPEGKATTYHFEYVTQAHFEAEGFVNPEETPESASIGEDFQVHKASAQVSVVPETKYHCRAVASNADAPAGVKGEEGTFTALEPLEIGATWSTEVGTEAATLNAEVNPLGIPTTGYFQYVDEATYLKDIAELGPEHGFDHAKRAPDVEDVAEPLDSEEPIEFGASESFKAGAATIAGLTPGTAYRYRILATDSLIAPKEVPGPTEAFRTYRSGEGGLPDDRAYELVSPAQKGSAEVGVPGKAGGLFSEQSLRINAAAGSGKAVTYTSWTSFGQPEGSPSANQYLSKRGEGGWATENISPFGFQHNPLRLPYRGFSADLGSAGFVISEPALTAEAQEGSENLYLRDDESGSLQALTTEAPVVAPSQNEEFCSGYAGASAGGKEAFFAANGAMAGAPVGKGFSLYGWSAEGGLGLISVLPDGSPAPPSESSFGAAASHDNPCAMDQQIVRHAVSTDGRIVFWTYGGKYLNSERPLLARIDGSETIQLDAKVPGEKAGGKGIFWAASADGSKAIFSAPRKLTADSKAEGQLYRFDTEARSATDLTPGNIDPEIQGVIGASEDGAYVYFVARGALTGEEETAAGEKAQTGANNLYLYHEGEGLRFIGALSGEDSDDWSPAPVRLTARVSPDGRHLAFTSIQTEALTATKGVPGSGYDNEIADGAGCQPNLEKTLSGDPHCAEAFLYDAEANSLACVSCNPSGSRPEGPTQLPTWSNPFEGPRYLSDDGQRLFFESFDSLEPGDENQNKRDVYEFERSGAGSCGAESPSFNLSSGGCLFLISSGRSTDASYLLDASSDGRDVFFSTRNSLTGWDTNENYDVYDARIGGGFPEPAQEVICEGEGCKPPPSAPPAPGSSPGTATWVAPGNPVAKHKKKHRHKTRKHRQKKRSHTRAHRNARAAR